MRELYEVAHYLQRLIESLKQSSPIHDPNRYPIPLLPHIPVRALLPYALLYPNGYFMQDPSQIITAVFANTAVVVVPIVFSGNRLFLRPNGWAFHE